MISFSELLGVKGIKTQKIKKRRRRKEVSWVDKYRPKKLSDVAYQYEVTKMLKQTIKTGELPHLLFYGGSGTGKTSTILAISRELYGPKRVHERVIELNASDERGINIVRKKIITFAKTSVGTADPDYPSPPYKIIILDEADAMTVEAQSALRKVMEEYSEITRFCFICNYINKIIEPIVSRCMPFRYKPIADKVMTKSLHHIAKNEKMEYEDKWIDIITNISDGDMRKSILLLQNLNYMKKLKPDLNTDDVYELVNSVPNNIITKIWEECKKPLNDKTIFKIRARTRNIKRLGYPINNILDRLLHCVLNDKDFSDIKKAKINMQLAKTETMLIEGADEYLQLLNILTYISMITNNIKIDI